MKIFAQADEEFSRRFNFCTDTIFGLYTSIVEKNVVLEYYLARYYCIILAISFNFKVKTNSLLNI